MGPNIYNYIITSIDIPVNYYIIAVCILLLMLFFTKRAPLSVLIAYVFLIFSQTVLSREITSEAIAEWRPFRIIFEDCSTSWVGVLSQIGANIIMFIPIGVLLYMVLRKFKISVLLAVLFATILELLQFVLHRGFCETDDIISNTIGAIVGFLLCSVLQRIRHKRNTSNEGAPL